MRATIETGEGAGDAVVATSWAGLVTFSCRIVVEPPATCATADRLPAR